MKLLRMFPFAALLLCAVFAVAQSPWQPVQGVPDGIGAGAILLLTDGSVLVHDEGVDFTAWYKLSPDMNGNYATGIWTKIANMPATYGPLYFGSAILPDGRMIVEGGEYNFGTAGGSEVKLGAIYDPVANSWQNVNPPAGWNTIGDGASVILTNGTYMQGSCCDNPPKAALLNASNLTWTSTGTGKFDPYVEEGLTLLPSGKVLDIDSYYLHYDPNGKNYEIYDPATGAWTLTGQTPVQLWDAPGRTYEQGPDVLMANGTVFAMGANANGSGHTAVYTTGTGNWVAGPDFGNNLNMCDGPAALEPNGKVIMMTTPGCYNPVGAVFFEWDGSSLTQIPAPPNAPNDNSYYGHFLVLPNGQVMFTDFSSDVEVYTPTGSDYNWKPSTILTSAVLKRGTTVVLQGNKFNGLTQGSAYGDDFQNATNYPIVRFTNASTGHVFYARTHDHNTMAVAYPGPSYTHVDIPSNMETGFSFLEIIANGVPSVKYGIGIN